MLPLLVICLLPGLAAALASRRFRPDPALVWWRTLLTTVALFGSGLLVASLAPRWWTIEDPELEATLVTDGTSAYPIVVVTIGVAGSGLRLATDALLVVTLAAAFASLGRRAERGMSRRPVLSGWDVFGVTCFAVLYLALVLGIVEVEGLGWVLLAVGLVAAAARLGTLRSGARTGADASR